MMSWTCCSPETLWPVVWLMHECNIKEGGGAVLHHASGWRFCPCWLLHCGVCYVGIKRGAKHTSP